MIMEKENKRTPHKAMSLMGMMENEVMPLSANENIRAQEYLVVPARRGTTPWDT
jgi:hypothetical protein